jgi:Arc/MetJ family transcription regulator
MGARSGHTIKSQKQILAGQMALAEDSIYNQYGSMKTTIDIPEKSLLEVMKFSGAKTKRAAIMTAVTDYNRRQSMARLTRHLGTCSGLITVGELAKQRAKG